MNEKGEENMKLLNFNYARDFLKKNLLCPLDYTVEDLMDSMKNRERFREVMNFISDCMKHIDDDVISDVFTNHYFIHCKTLNDGLIVALTLCNMIYSKYDYEIGDYLINRSLDDEDFAKKANAEGGTFVKIISGVGEEQVQEKSTYLPYLDHDNPAVFLYEESTLKEIFEYDPEGVKVCFVIWADEMEKQNNSLLARFFCDDNSNSVNIPPKQVATELHYTFFDITSESENQKALYIKNFFELKDYDYSSVERKIKQLASHPSVKDEYTAVSAAQAVINNHIAKFHNDKKLRNSDFSDYVHLCKTKEKSRIKKESCGLVGLEKELETLNGAVSMLRLDIERKNAGLSQNISGCNMVFAGQPGTAKTTLAREFGRLLCEQNIIPDMKNFRECRKSDIVGKYVGHTAAQIDQMFTELSECGGGVLFFDEIYTLSEEQSTCFDTEAVNCITQNMENFRSNVYCIFAGYENKMKRFMDSNPGLSSRIATSIKFSPYDDEMLEEIFKSIVSSENFTVLGEYHDILKTFFSRLREIRGENFGNGREARNLFENAKRIMAVRIMAKAKHKKSDLSKITVDDIKKAADDILNSVVGGNDKKIKIGF